MPTKLRYWKSHTCTLMWRGVSALIVIGLLAIVAVTQVHHLHGFIINGAMIAFIGLIVDVATLFPLNEAADEWAYTWLHTGKRDEQQTQRVLFLLGLDLIGGVLVILGLSVMLTRQWWVAFLPIGVVFWAIGALASVDDDHLALLATLPCPPREYYHRMQQWLKQHRFDDWAEVESDLLLAQVPAVFMRDHNFTDYAPTQGMTAVCRDFTTHVGPLSVIHQLLPTGLLPLTTGEICGLLSAQLSMKGGLRDEK